MGVDAPFHSLPVMMRLPFTVLFKNGLRREPSAGDAVPWAWRIQYVSFGHERTPERDAMQRFLWLKPHDAERCEPPRQKTTAGRDIRRSSADRDREPRLHSAEVRLQGSRE